MQVAKKADSSPLQLSLSQQPLQNSMVQLGSNVLSFSPRKKLSLHDETQFDQLRKSLISSPSNQQTSGKDLTKSQATFSFAPRSPVSRQGGAINGTGQVASPTGRQFWSPRAGTKPINPEIEKKIQGDQQEKANASWTLQQKSSSQKAQIVKEVVELLKNEHINPLFSSLKSEMTKNISQLQTDLSRFKNETALALKKQQN